ncbi:MAG: protease self-immunity protein family [Mucilaginibacter sp.]|nr:protease self-immunity protein family [Mucilaginibacter sp.]
MAISNEKKAGFILSGFILIEGSWVLMNFIYNGKKFWYYMGFGPGNNGALLGWILALLAALLYIYQSARFPSVRQHLFKVSFLKLLALGVAVFASILEEVVFRKWLMDFMLHKGFGIIIQVLASGFLFGFIHGIWGLFGSKKAAIGATIATGSLGVVLAIVYVAADRIVAPCIAAHFLINLFIEPGLVLAATRREMGKNDFGS